MSQRRVAVLFSVVAMVFLVSLPAAGQDASGGWELPRTPDGRPDFQGTWNFATITPLERPSELSGREFLTDEEVAALEQEAIAGEFTDRPVREGDTGTYNQFWFDRGTTASRQTSLIVDPPGGRLPPLTAEAQKREESAEALRIAEVRRGRGPAASWEDMPMYTRCHVRPMPRIQHSYNQGMQILQTPGHVVIFYESMHDARIIPLDGRPHVGPTIRQWLGDARGRWEGDTLVVETTNYTDKTQIVRGGSRQTEALHVVERLTRIDENTISYEVTIEDPRTWTQPWTFRLPWRQDADYELFEYACHERNYSIENVLSGARAQENADAQAGSR